MRYQLPVYPLLVIFGAWYLFQLWDKAKAVRAHTFNLKRVLVFMLGALVLGLTFAWGFAFSRIYTRPHTRVEASRWLFQNMPGPVNLSILTQDGIYNQPLAYPQDVTIRANFPYQIRFNALADGTLTEIYLPHAVDKMSTTDLSLMLTLSSLSEDQIVATETISAQELYNGSGAPYAYTWQEPTALIQGETYSLALSLLNDYEDLAICGPLVLDIQTVSGPLQLELPLYAGCLGPADLPYPLQFGMDVTGILQNVSMTIQIEQPEIESQSKTLAVEMVGPGGEILVSEELTADFESKDGQRGQSYRIPIANGPAVQNGESYTLNFSLESGVAAIAFSGSSAANESSWDDGLPLRLDGYDPYGGIYPGGLNFEMYWDDNLEKFERFVTTLDQADYILITSSRQWASTTRVPERYPLTTEYYRRLLGCPVENTIEWCYDVAEPGRFQGDLGFALVKVFQSNPSIGTFEINDQFSEEAFTVYDHPKVFVFEKTLDYDPAGVRNLLGAVDLTKVIRVTPKQADSFPGNLMLSPGRLEEQRRGGTWSDYFNPEALQNRLQILGVLLWYGSVGLLGLLVYPLVRFTMPGLADRGYPFARITGLLLLSAIVWLAGSARLPFNRTTIGLALGAIVLLGVFLGYRQREQLRREFTERKQYFLWIEVLFLVFFLVGLLIRFGNPDLWHPWKGGEKPMDFAYFNAVLKSTSFPPYDPWFAGGYINYYYYGFVVVGVLVKFLGIVPSIAYNLILPTLLSMIAMGAFSIVWNLFGSDPKEPDNPGGMDGSDIPKSGSREKRHPVRSLQFIASLSGALGMAILGNLGILQMFAKGLQMNAVPAAELETAGFFSKLFWTFSGFFKTIAGTPLPIRMDEWYWNPSRVIAAQHGSPITEFPFFTFLYADLHAHLIALPVALLGVAWVVSVVRGRAWERTGGRSWLQIGLGLLVGGLAIGALYPINLSDIYTYLPLGAAALVYATWRYVDVEALTVMKGLSKTAKRLVISGLAVLALVALTQIIYQPYIHWFDQGYSKFRIWDGTHTPLSEYLTHWGVFLFILVSWMFYESIDWMANTPASALRKLAPYRGLIWAGVSLTIILMMALGINLYPQGLPPDKVPIGLGIHIVWLVLPLVVWSGVLLLRPGISDAKRIVLFMVGTGLVLTLMVELIVVSGDIGRMNTVFKFYFHAWTFFAVSSGAALGWLVTSMPKWSLNTRTVWQILLGFLVFSAALYPLLGSTAKIMDRMEVTAPHTLDGMTYMRYATYADEGATMDLSQDYNAIRWMQENIVGSPVLVEANLVEYHWGTRFSSYTGLPEVVGWNWHERQKRTATPQDWVYERVDAVHEFYQTEDLQWVREFLQKYEISYIIFGQLEQARYPGPGLDKFTAQDGILWHEIFRDRDTIIYQVIR
jgi:YYY domain-containing protein